jgi:2-aminoadipate transaminase
MSGALKAGFPAAVEWLEPEGGLYFWARLPRRTSCGLNSKLFTSALARNVLYVPGEICYADDPKRRKPDHEMRLSFGNATEEHIRTGAARLGGVMRGILDK